MGVGVRVGVGVGVGSQRGPQGDGAEIQCAAPGRAAEGAGMVEGPGVVRQVCMGPGAWEGFPV